MKFNIRTLFPEGNGYSDVISDYSENISREGVFYFVKINAPENFWDDTINDDNLDTDVYIYGETYSVADVLKQVNPVVYDNKVNEFWKEAKKDIIDFVSDIGEGETETLFGIFEVTRIE